MNEIFYLTPLDGIYVIILSAFIGMEVVRKVPPVLHTPLMSGSNAISGIVVAGSIIQIMSNDIQLNAITLLSFVGLLLGVMNIAGGFFVTHRMLKMFKSKSK